MTVLFANIFLGCFILGFLLTAGTFMFGIESHGGGHAGDFGHGGDLSGGGHGGHGGHGGDGSADSGSHGHRGMPLLNLNSIALFFTWFGAVGYILNSEAKAGPLVSLVGAVAAGFAGALIICAFVNRFLMKGDTTMRESDYYMPGTLARVTSSIRAGGLGEIVYVQGGTRKTAGARSDEDVAHPQGQEVVIVRYEKGIAFVRAVALDGQDDLPDGPDSEAGGAESSGV